MRPSQLLRFSEGIGLISAMTFSATGDLDGSLCFTDLLNKRGAVRLELGDRNLLHDGLNSPRAEWPF